MPTHIIVVDRQRDFTEPGPNRVVVTANDFLHGRGPAARLRGGPTTRVINLCADVSYLSLGYYCSLLAEARGHRVIPSVAVLLDLNWKRLYQREIPALEEAFRKVLPPPEERGTRREVRIFFGRPAETELRDVGRRTFDAFRSPLLSVQLRFGRAWHIEAVRPLTLRDLAPEEHARFADALDRHTHASWRPPKASEPARYSLAVLHDPHEPLPPSDGRALRRLAKAGGQMGVQVDLITRRDLAKLGEYDALFIRETTAIDHHTFRFARKAEAEGIPVIDDPGSIMRCTNKVFLAELLEANKVPAPRTVIFGRRRIRGAAEDVSYPVVLKIPDGSFSRGVHKARNPEEFRTLATRMLRESDLILAQEYMVTDFDWRVGVLNRKPLFVCQYFMAKNHWQIVKHGAGNRFEEGRVRTMKVEDAPADVVDVALRAANLMGDGLYGVDVKQTDAGVFVMEVNDNPNLDGGVEDAVLGDDLYRALIAEFVRRIERRPA